MGWASCLTRTAETAIPHYLIRDPKGGYSNVSEYILHLILQEQAKAARVKALLLEGLDSGEPIEVTDDWWEQKRTQLIQGLQQT